MSARADKQPPLRVRVLEVMSGGEWFTARQLADRLGSRLGSLNPALRKLWAAKQVNRVDVNGRQRMYGLGDPPDLVGPAKADYGTAETAQQAFEASGCLVRREGPSTLRVSFKTKTGRWASWWYSCRTGRWKYNAGWSAEFGPRGIAAFLQALACEADPGWLEDVRGAA